MLIKIRNRKTKVMEKTAKDLDFMKAAKLRNEIKALQDKI
jgi:excinuclease ABC subunit B